MVIAVGYGIYWEFVIQHQLYRNVPGPDKVWYSVLGMVSVEWHVHNGRFSPDNVHLNLGTVFSRGKVDEEE